MGGLKHAGDSELVVPARRGLALAAIVVATPAGGERKPTSPALPDWLLTGAWITVPPHRAEHLPAEARSFVNEFVPIHGEDVPPAREQMVARDGNSDAPSAVRESATPPHGDKLR